MAVINLITIIIVRRYFIDENRPIVGPQRFFLSVLAERSVRILYVTIDARMPEKDVFFTPSTDYIADYIYIM